MTKSEVRAVCMSKLCLPDDAVCWDIGAGTGSMSVEMALQVKRGKVYAVECRDEAVDLIKENRRRFSVDNLTVIHGAAPEACCDLPMPTHAFIGGSSGNIREIVACLLEKNPSVHIVATAVSLESICELTSCIDFFHFNRYEIVSLSVARSKLAGSHHLMQSLNPVYVFSFQTKDTCNAGESRAAAGDSDIATHLDAE